ncbi:hypothetical protein L218DRAFT_1032641 [Marasmius fiardii PR-910]|nr:hypothetical protein L218DRAFT_1032641 [Marasmius fiardii PR-910]
MAAIPVDPLQAYLVEFTPSLRLLILGTAWAAALVPLLVLLFWLSTPTIRRQPIFIMNVLTVTMGIVIGIINIQIHVSQILTSTEPKSKTLLAYLGMIFMMPVLMDCMLAYRLTAVYPRQITSNVVLTIVFVPIVTVKIARLTNITIFMVILSHGGVYFRSLWAHAPYVKIEWIFQVVDNWCVAFSIN